MLSFMLCFFLGYYFVEEFVNLKQKRLVPVPPENVDTSELNIL
jgi:hypothetical protein